MAMSGFGPLRDRTRRFALDIVRLTGDLPRYGAADVMGRQLLRSGTSVAANYRATCRARSKADFIAKMGIVEEEADESHFWLELLCESGLIQESRLKALLSEADQLTAIAVASRKTAGGRA